MSKHDGWTVPPRGGGLALAGSSCAALVEVALQFVLRGTVSRRLPLRERRSTKVPSAAGDLQRLRLGSIPRLALVGIGPRPAHLAG